MCDGENQLVIKNEGETILNYSPSILAEGEQLCRNGVENIESTSTLETPYSNRDELSDPISHYQRIIHYPPMDVVNPNDPNTQNKASINPFSISDYGEGTYKLMERLNLCSIENEGANSKSPSSYDETAKNITERLLVDGTPDGINFSFPETQSCQGSRFTSAPFQEVVHSPKVSRDQRTFTSKYQLNEAVSYLKQNNQSTGPTIDTVQRKEISDKQFKPDDFQKTTKTTKKGDRKNKDSKRESAKLDSSAKPPYSYVALISLAIQESSKKKLQLSDIYKWIKDNFPYFGNQAKSGKHGWKNSIRHNLSLNECFVKLPRESASGGKGNFWTVTQKFEEMFEPNNYKRRTRKNRQSMRYSPYKNNYYSPLNARPYLPANHVRETWPINGMQVTQFGNHSQPSLSHSFTAHPYFQMNQAMSFGDFQYDSNPLKETSNSIAAAPSAGALHPQMMTSHFPTGYANSSFLVSDSSLFGPTGYRESLDSSAHQASSVQVVECGHRNNNVIYSDNCGSFQNVREPPDMNVPPLSNLSGPDATPTGTDYSLFAANRHHSYGYDACSPNSSSGDIKRNIEIWNQTVPWASPLPTYDSLEGPKLR